MLDIRYNPSLISPAWNCHGQNCVGSHQPLISVMRRLINSGGWVRFLLGVGMFLPRGSTAIAMTLRKLNTGMCRIMPKKLPYAELATQKVQQSMLHDSQGAGKSGLPGPAEGVKHSFWSTEFIRQFGQNPKVGASRDSAG
jgi:hypothetical protein